MIKFFRRIRQQLLTENKFSKYMLYAIGEILLVVIGILIALHINNRNEESKEQTQVKMYLGSLIETLNDDISYLEYTQSGNTFRSKCIQCLLALSTGEAPKAQLQLKYELDPNYISNSLDIK